VLFNPVRDANPFFHLMESLWMLRGQRDVQSMVRYNKRMDEYSDDGEVFHGAYGYRWRNHFSQDYRLLDQINIIIRRLKKDPIDRRCVLQMWDAPYDLNVNKVDIPCNTHVYFKIRTEKLHMTVCCRSNDIIWGAYGANAVHFSMLQQYIADSLGVAMGPYVQISDSFHAYKNVFDAYRIPEEGLPCHSRELYDNFSNTRFRIPRDLDFGDAMFYKSSFYKELIEPMTKAWDHWKNGEWQAAFDTVKSQMPIQDWRHACLEWLERRKPNA
jgi:thymidylate synthase